MLRARLQVRRVVARALDEMAVTTRRPDDLEARRARALISAVVRGPGVLRDGERVELPIVWVQFFDCESAVVERRLPLQFDGRNRFVAQTPTPPGSLGVDVRLFPSATVDVAGICRDALLTLPRQRVSVARSLLALSSDLRSDDRAQILAVIVGMLDDEAHEEARNLRSTALRRSAEDGARQATPAPAGSWSTPAARLAQRCADERDRIAAGIEKRLDCDLSSHALRSNLTSAATDLDVLDLLDDLVWRRA